ncbi:MAG: aldehyde dehydrogenase [Opitutales bacterium]|jgi:lactaldehyde dehydrogenase / glycolaldehyde dehydrogenase|nr:aldehyde dehydrogenase [Opitutales bacterium]MDP4644726.1 aldehyde dehydrogenase [Opitutales bacterium]MDP4777575.1 aldehyde dehydrogenase [Opitutales bacterium]MDP4884254.1 aldehyde dehydrogenase [Opitutales bacterium]MDP5080123.1 aldehyde dehydrogenase [Opitutales bacterium]
MIHYSNYINGQFVESSHGDTITVINPSTGEAISTIPNSTAAEVDAAIDAAEAAQPAWGALPAIERAKHLHVLADKLREKVEPLARCITEEQGKTLGLARVEVNFTADYLDYMAEWGRRIEGEIIESDRPKENIFLFHKPIGVVAGILPWNFPFFLIARKMAPALICGNSIVLKPSEETPNNAFEFCKILAETDIPAGLVNLVSGLGAVSGRALTENPKVGLISFTGSVETGSRIMGAAAKHITKVNLELGGKAPAIVTANADLDMAATAIQASRVINSGQVCNCAERVYVQRSVAEAFTDKLVEKMKAARFGNPLEDETVDYGPMINQAGYEKIVTLLESSVAAGAKVLCGGKRGGDEGGFYFEPTVVGDCTQDMDLVQKEIFGPVVPIVIFDTLDEAVAMANDTEYGLTSSVFSNDINEAMNLVEELNFGETYINREHFEAMQGYHAGWRKSGIGGADGKHGLYEFMQTQVVYMQRH